MSEDPIYVDGEDVMPGVRDSWAKLATFSSEVRSGNWKGAQR